VTLSRSAQRPRQSIRSGVVLPVAEPSHAVFLSYASQDAEATQRICEALRAGGIEVWFDKSELRGGDAWDRSIRQQIHDCALFVPIISQHTHERLEGYFRREWRLAVERAGDMAENKAFLVPVVIDSTTERDPSVPEKFRELQWTRLPGGETPTAFVERVRRLLSHEDLPALDPARSTDCAVASDGPAPRGLIHRRTGVLYGAIAAVGLLALGYVGLERLNRSKPSVQGAASIAVLPLANESGDASQQYLSDGISEDLITALSQFPGLRVIGRTSAFQFRESKEDSRSIGSKLGVAHLLEGSVRRSGEVVRVSAELIDTADGSTQWSERYDRPYKDLFALQDEITRAVAGALRAKLLPGENAAAQSDRPPSGSLEAYNALLQGRFYLARRTEADYRKAIESYTQAIELDPRFALAWSELSRAWTDLGNYFLEGAPKQEAHAKARAAADRALTISPELAAAHIARGHLLQIVDLDWRGAEAELRRAMELAPNNGEAKFYFGQQLATFGQVEPAIELTRQALATEPLRAEWYKWLGYYLSGLNRLDEAERAIRRAIELQPASAVHHSALTIIEVQRGDAQAALSAAQREPPGGWQDVALALARQIGGDRSAADAALKTLIDKGGNGYAFQIVEVYALRNDAKATFEWLDRALSNRDPDIGTLLFDPFILRYKDDPRFAAFCRKVGLPAPGETSSRNST
jgi:TolB-like protein/Tfp pilus assembly protein PilF